MADIDSQSVRSEPEGEASSPAGALTGELIERVGWFVRLRWLAVLAVVAGTVTGDWLGFPVPVGWLLLLGAVIASYNLLLKLWWKRLASSSSGSPRFLRAFCFAQIILDYLALAVAIHLTGGIESPLTIFFIFHIIVAAIVLPGRHAYLDAVLAAALVGAVAVLEGFATIGHHAVLFRETGCFYDDAAVAAAWYFFLVLTLLISSLIAAPIGALLDRKIQDLYYMKNSLEAANERLKAADREKTEFMNLVTHELRSPLVAIRGILQALMDQYAGQLNVQQLSLLRRTDRRAEQMIDMVNDLLRLAHSRSGAPRELATFDLGEEVEHVVELFRPQAVQAGVDLSFAREGGPLFVRADRGDVRYVATNLISNAVKYTPPGGSVGVRIDQGGEAARLEVSDTGIGIPAADLPNLFTEFFRASNAKKQHAAGTGLGLAISKRLIVAHGGEISVTSEFGKGSTFTVKLPGSARFARSARYGGFAAHTPDIPPPGPT